MTASHPLADTLDCSRQRYNLEEGEVEQDL